MSTIRDTQTIERLRQIVPNIGDEAVILLQQAFLSSGESEGDVHAFLRFALTVTLDDPNFIAHGSDPVSGWLGTQRQENAFLDVLRDTLPHVDPELLQACCQDFATRGAQADRHEFLDEMRSLFPPLEGATPTRSAERHYPVSELSPSASAVASHASVAAVLLVSTAAALAAETVEASKVVSVAAAISTVLVALMTRPEPRPEHRSAGGAKVRSRTSVVAPPVFRFSCTDRLLGSGSFAKVYLGRCEVGSESQRLRMGALVAVKKTDMRELTRMMDEVEAKKHRARLMREKNALRMVSDRNVIKLFQSVTRGEWFMELVLEYMAGGTLAQWLASAKRLGDPVAHGLALEITTSILSGLVALHNAQVVHRDLKPANVMFTVPLSLQATSLGEVVVKIADLGLAVFDPEATVRGTGTWGYMPLEQQRLEAAGIDGRADIFAIGVIFYQLLSGGSMPWNAQDIFVMRDEMQSERYRKLPPEVPDSYKGVVTRMLRALPSRRPHASEALQLVRGLAGEPVPPDADPVRPSASLYLHPISCVDASRLRVGPHKVKNIETTLWGVDMGTELMPRGAVSPLRRIGEAEAAVFRPPDGANRMRWLYASSVADPGTAGLSPDLLQFVRHGGIVFYRKGSDVPVAAAVVLSERLPAVRGGRSLELRFGQTYAWRPQFNRRLMGAYGHSAAERIQSVPPAWWPSLQDPDRRPCLYAVVFPGETIDSPSTSESLSPSTVGFIFWYGDGKLFDARTVACISYLVPMAQEERLSGREQLEQLVQVAKLKARGMPEFYGELLERLPALRKLPSIPTKVHAEAEVCRTLDLRKDTHLKNVELVCRRAKSLFGAHGSGDLVLELVASGLCQQAEGALAVVGEEGREELFERKSAAHNLIESALVATFDAIGTVGALEPVDTFAKSVLEEVLQHPILDYLQRCSMQSVVMRPRRTRVRADELQAELDALRRTPPASLPETGLAELVWKKNRHLHLKREPDLRTRELMLRCASVVGDKESRLHNEVLEGQMKTTDGEGKEESTEALDVFLALIHPRYSHFEVTWRVAAKWLQQVSSSVHRQLIPQIVATLRSVESPVYNGRGPWALLDAVVGKLMTSEVVGLGTEWVCLSHLWWALVTEFIAEQNGNATGEAWARVVSRIDMVRHEQFICMVPAERMKTLKAFGVSKQEGNDILRWVREVEEERRTTGVHFQALMRLRSLLSPLQEARVAKQQKLVWLLDTLSAKLRKGSMHNAEAAIQVFESGVTDLITAGGSGRGEGIEDSEPESFELVDMVRTEEPRGDDAPCLVESSERAHLTLPLDPTKVIVGVLIGKVKIFSSACRPFKVEFWTAGDKEPYRMMYKQGDDLRRDKVVLQVVERVDELFKTNGLRMHLRLTPYRVLPTSNSSGMLQFVVSEPLQQHVYGSGDMLTRRLPEMVRRKWEGALSHEDSAKLDNWVYSNAAYAVITFMLGVGDRHLENLMVDSEFRLFHIDYGYILGQDPKMSIDVKLRNEMKKAMGEDEEDQRRFETSCAAVYLGIRRHAGELLGLLNAVSKVQCRGEGGQDVYMLTSNVEVEAVERAIENVQERLQLNMDDGEAIDFISYVVRAAGTGTVGMADRFIDYFHFLLHG
eukprot:Hpha_TRINITY_DN16918_c0_g1::TRINITY_DN16918_c0_g1_i6::g.55688::m.55688/K00914/PIK3C3, VPS34; phosphatidylinositol 3-kinase